MYRCVTPGAYRTTAVAVLVVAVAMAYLESAVVVYLQLALGGEVGAIFPLRPAIEVGSLVAIDTADLLFLIPVPWVGPVWSPVAVSVALVGVGLIAVRSECAGRTLNLGRRHWAAGDVLRGAESSGSG